MNCPKCGKEIANDSNFCEYCGNPVKKSHKKTMWNVLAVLLLMGGAFFMGVQLSGETTKEVTEVAEDTLEYEVSTELPPVEAPAELAEVVDYVDLGLPSGTIWYTSNETGFYTYEEAVSQFGTRLPTKEQWEELKAECQWHWTGSGYKITGNNGNTMTLPAMGGRTINDNVVDVGFRGYYCSSTPNGSEKMWSFKFDSNDVYMSGEGRRRLGRSVRLVQD